MARAGGELRASRRRRRLTQRQIAAMVGVSQPTISRMERGRGARLSVDVWQRAFVAVDRRLIFEASRDPAQEPADAGHLQVQELVLGLGRRTGSGGLFELATRPNDPLRSADVGLRSDARRRLDLVECWNVIGDIGAAARSTSRKLAELEALAIVVGGEQPYRVGGCWVVRATARNRALIARYPEVFASRFPGSSAGWVKALATGSEPPGVPGLVWCDVAATRLFPWRRRR
jgi:transcriptional regulator with XRE-family HTH domain